MQRLDRNAEQRIARCETAPARQLDKVLQRQPGPGTAHCEDLRLELDDFCRYRLRPQGQLTRKANQLRPQQRDAVAVEAIDREALALLQNFQSRNPAGLFRRVHGVQPLLHYLLHPGDLLIDFGRGSKVDVRGHQEHPHAWHADLQGVHPVAHHF